MKRTIATAQPLCDALGCKMELRPALEEMHYGKWEDKTAEFVKEYYWDDYCLFLVIHLFGNLQLLLPVEERPGLVLARNKLKHCLNENLPSYGCH